MWTLEREPEMNGFYLSHLSSRLADDVHREQPAPGARHRNVHHVAFVLSRLGHGILRTAAPAVHFTFPFPAIHT